ncbi:MAG: hypothetical protein HC845_01735 [Akkermansiaceae bacterium]|nr:hypothetical protein [Akkermansiaceae bacterium]
MGEALIGNIFLKDVPAGSVKVFSDEWWDLTRHALREGGRVGVNVGLFNCPGWSQSGGPWVKPEQAMRRLATSEIRVTGPKNSLINSPRRRPSFRIFPCWHFPLPQMTPTRFLLTPREFPALPQQQMPGIWPMANWTPPWSCH